MTNDWITMSLDQVRNAKARGFYIAPDGCVHHMDNMDEDKLPTGIVRVEKGEYLYKGTRLVNV